MSLQTRITALAQAVGADVKALLAAIAGKENAGAATAALDAHAAAPNPHPQYQVALESGINLKTVNGESLLGAGNLVVAGGGAVTGDIILTARTLAAPDWLPASGGNYLRASYPALFGVVGVALGPWTARTAAAANSWKCVTYGNGLFVAVASDGTSRVMTSPDGITWTARTAAEVSGWYSITYGNGLFVAVAYSGTNRVMTSPDGITWTARTAAESNVWQAITYGNSLFVAIAETGANRVMTSAHTAPEGAFTVPAVANPTNARYYIKA